MKSVQKWALLLAGLVLIAGCQKPDTGANTPPPTPPADPSLPTQAQPKLPTVRLWIGPEQMDAEMAETVDQIRTGMMFRTSMGTNDGMIFDLRYPQQAAFWMKNCFIPLSVAYINPEGAIEEIHPLEPQNTNSVYSATNDIRFALETPQGWFDQHNIRPGMVIRTDRGSLMEAFGQRQ